MSGKLELPYVNAFSRYDWSGTIHSMGLTPGGRELCGYKQPPVKWADKHPQEGD